MSDKLFKNDLTPSVCQRDGNAGELRPVPPSSLSSRHALHNSLTPSLAGSLLTEGMVQARMLLISPRVSSSECAVLAVLGVPAEKAGLPPALASPCSALASHCLALK